MITQVALILWLASLTVSEEIDYCKLCPKEGSHTMCKYPEPGAVRPCLSYPVFDERRMDTKALYAIISFHNDLRTTIAQGKSQFSLPQAANMYAQIWEPEAADIAQRWADQCKLSLDECRDCFDNDRNIKPYAQSIGQYEASVNTNDSVFLMNILENWVKEGKRFQAGQIPSYNYSKGTENFAHMIWGEAYFIGCGRVEIPNDAAGTKTVRLVCNYGPNAGQPKKPLYKRGEPMSGCKGEESTVNEVLPGLCLARSLERSDFLAGGTVRVTYSDLYLEILIISLFIVIMST